MSERREDPEVARLKRRLDETNQALEAALQREEQAEPLIDRLGKHLKENRFAERLVAGLEQTRRRQA